MMISRIAVLSLLCISSLLFVVSCDKLALTGPKKYKVDLMNIMQDVTDSIEKDGEVPDKKIKEFETFLTEHQEEYGKKGSHIRCMRIIEDLKMSQTDEQNRFRLYQGVKAQIEQVILTLQTEVPD